MVYQKMGSALTVDQILQSQRARLSAFKTDAFEWKSEYLPLIIGAAGLAAVVLVISIKKKGRKKKK